MRAVHALLLLMLLAWPPHALAQQAQRIDDSASQVLDGLVRMKWKEVRPGPGASNDLVGQTTVLVRLDMSPFQGRSGRIFMVLEKQSGPVRAAWTTRGALLPGEVRDGERALVFAGAVASERIEDTLVLTITASTDVFSQPEKLVFHFEFEAGGA
ncbi:MAG TPA: hypothetical protein DC063_09885 [Arenimonas sp.]|nr:MAG: hypothetical protein A2X76_08975 [Xanthomonadales bacterium GWF1_69_6]HBD20348.1 hypothetical protein [Arenimonas sp.]